MAVGTPSVVIVGMMGWPAEWRYPSTDHHGKQHFYRFSSMWAFYGSRYICWMELYYQLARGGWSQVSLTGYMGDHFVNSFYVQFTHGWLATGVELAPYLLISYHWTACACRSEPALLRTNLSSDYSALCIHTYIRTVENNRAAWSISGVRYNIAWRTI